jgi:hypothetical protein
MSTQANVEPEVRFDNEGNQLPFSESEVNQLVPLVAHHYAPRRFALCEVERDSDGQPFDVHVIAWGIQTGLSDDSVQVFGYTDANGQSMRGSFASAERAVQLLRGQGDVRLAWVDAESAD